MIVNKYAVENRSHMQTQTDSQYLLECILKSDFKAKSRFTQKKCSDPLTIPAIEQEQEIVAFAAIHLKPQIVVFVYKCSEYVIKWSDCSENHFCPPTITTYLQSFKNMTYRRNMALNYSCNYFNKKMCVS